MALTAAQLTTWKTDIAANTNPIVGGPLDGIPINQLSLTNGDHAFEIAKWYSLLASPAWIVWQTAVSIDVIQDAIIYANMTPAQAIPTSPQLDVMVWLAKANACQGKQFNLQNLLLGKSAVNASKANIRAAFQDCLTGLPSKADGTNQAAGWTTVQTAMQRSASRIEKLLSTGVGDTNSPATMGYEGSVTYQDLQA